MESDAAGSQGFNRRLRKLIHILGGVPVFLIPLAVPVWDPYVLALGGLYLLLLLPLVLLPQQLSEMFDELIKPGEGPRNLTGGSTYFLVLGVHFLLVAPLLGNTTAALAALMLTVGDGLSALIGTRDSAAWPWNAGKPVIGTLGAAAGVLAAWTGYLVLSGAQLGLEGYLLIIGAAAAGALIESLPFEDVVDDNLIVGMAGVALALPVQLIVAG